MDVDLILPSLSDSGLTLGAGRSHYEDLLEAGVRIHDGMEPSSCAGKPWLNEEEANERD